MGSGSEISEDECVVRYVNPRKVHDDGRVDASAFVRRPADIDGLSISVPSVFNGTATERLTKVVGHIRTTVKKSGRFACFSVGEMRRLLRDHGICAVFRRHPLEAEANLQPDPAHALIVGLPGPEDEVEAVRVATAMAEAVSKESLVIPPIASPKR